jgi:glutathione S-transferase
MELFSYPENYRVWKSRIVAQFNGVKLPPTETAVELDGKANRSDAYLALNPFGQVPALKLEGNQSVFESNSIARYVTRLGDGRGRKDLHLYGTNIAEASRIDSFLDAVSYLEDNLGRWSYKVDPADWAQDFTKPWSPEFVKEKVDNAKKSLTGFEVALKQSSFLVGNSITLADIAWWCAVWRGFKYVFGKQFLTEYPRCSAHFRKLEAMPEFQAVVKETVPVRELTPELKFVGGASGGALPVRYHRVATVTDGKQSFRFKIYPENQAVDVQETIRTRFGIRPHQRAVLIDQDGCDVIIDGSLETGNYTLQVFG